MAQSLETKRRRFLQYLALVPFSSNITALNKTQPINLEAFGDSITVGWGASDMQTTSWAPLVAKYKSLILDNRAVGASTLIGPSLEARNQYKTIMETLLNETCVSVFLTGFNDMRYFGEDLNALATYSRRLTEVLRYIGQFPTYVGNCLRMTPEGYTSFGPDWNKGSNKAVTMYNEAIRQVIDQVKKEGFNITHVDASAVYNPSKEVSPTTGVHPNDTGHAKIAREFLMIMSPNYSQVFSPFNLLNSTHL